MRKKLQFSRATLKRNLLAIAALALLMVVGTLLSDTPTASAQANAPATGSPRISGMAEVGQSLFIVRWGSLINISDEDGMSNAVFSYQWVRNDGSTDSDIQDATGSSYTLTDADEGKAVKVRVSFTDDKGNPEAVTSSMTPAVTARPNTSDLGAPTYLWSRSSRGDERGIELKWEAPEGTVTGYQILRNEYLSMSDWWNPLPYGCSPLLTVHIVDTGSDATTYTDTDVGEFATYSYSVRAINSDGVGRRSRINSIQYRPPGDPGAPQALRNRDTTTTRVNDGVELTWDAPAGDVTGYQILRRRPEQCEFGYRVYVENTNSTGTTWVDKNVVAGTLYDYRIKAINDAGVGSLSWSWSNTPSIRPARLEAGTEPNSSPTGVPTITGTAQVGETLTADTSGIDDADGLSGARFSYQWLSGQETVIQGATGKTYTLTSTDEGETVSVRVNFTDNALNQEVLTSAATTEIAAGSDPTEVEETPQETPAEVTSVPGAPTDLSVSTFAYGHGEGIILRWWEPGGTVTGYQILRQRSRCDDDYLVHVEDTGSDATTYTDMDVVEGVRYFYVVKAINSEGVGSQSNFGTVQYPWLRDRPASGAPAAPSGLDSAGTKYGIELTWEAATEEVSGYQILRRTPELCEPVLRVHVENTDSTDTRWMDTEVEPGTLYEYRVTAINDAGVGHRSNSTRSRQPVGTGIFAVVFGGEFPLAPGQPEEITIGVGGLDRDDDPDTVDYTLRGDITLNDGSDADECEGEGLGEDIQIVVVDEVSEVFRLTFGGPGCGAGTYTLTLVLKDRDGQEVGTFEFLEFRQVGEDGLLEGTTQNNPATGVPTIRGTAEVGETLTADTSGISDEDGPTNPTFSYQWVRSDGSTDTDIQDATSSTYTLTSDDQGNILKVRVSFTDDAGNEESLTSPPLDPSRPHGLTTTVSGSAVVLNWNPPVGFRYLYDYRILRNRPELGEAEPLVYVDTGTAETTYTDTEVEPGVLYVYRVRASNYFARFSKASEPVVIRIPETVPTANSPATGAPTISGTAQVDETLTVDTSGIADADGLDNVSFSYQWVVNDGTSDADIEDASGTTYTLTSDDEGKTVKVRVTFTDDADNEESLTSAATAAVGPKLTASIVDAPESHDGENGFTFELRFSEEPEPDFSYKTLRDQAFAVTGGTVIDARRLERPSNVRWEITVEPSSDDNVSIVLPETTDCANQGAICTEDGRMLLAEMSLTVAGPVEEEEQTPPENNPATGVPTTSGTAQVGETLTVDTSGIADTDGLANATFSYQWLADDVDIVGATGASYTLTDSDEGKAIKVRASFTDDAGNDESLTSAPTVTVAAAPTPLTASVHDAPESHDGENVFTFELRFSEEPDPDFSYKTLRDSAFTVTGGEVEIARRLNKPSNIRWEITVKPDGNGEITIILSATTDCEAEGAICTEDGRKLSNRLEFTVSGPSG